MINILLTYCIYKNKKIHTLIFLLTLFVPFNLWAACEATLRWNSTPEPNVYYQLYMREAGASYDYDSFEWQGAESHVTVDQLDESKTYYFVVRVTDEEGNQSADSNEVAFKNGREIEATSSLSSNGGGGGGSSSGGINGGCFIRSLLYR